MKVTATGELYKSVKIDVSGSITAPLEVSHHHSNH